MSNERERSASMSDHTQSSEEEHGRQSYGSEAKSSYDRGQLSPSRQRTRDELIDELAAAILIETHWPHPSIKDFMPAEEAEFRSWAETLSNEQLAKEAQQREVEHTRRAKGINRPRQGYRGLTRS